MKQPNALRLAEALYAASETGAMPDDIQGAADELVRLYEANQAMLEALKSASGDLYRASSFCNTYQVLGLVNDAIAKVEQA